MALYSKFRLKTRYYNRYYIRYCITEIVCVTADVDLSQPLHRLGPPVVEGPWRF
jgi:hypothetical protein